jgi:hypothetical protein
VQIAVENQDLGSFGASSEPAERMLQMPALDHASTLQHGLFDQSAGTRAAIKAGVLGFFVGMIPFLGIVLTGWLAVYFYRREKGLVPVARIGSRLGGAAGVVAFGISSLWVIIRVFVLHGQQEYIDNLLKVAQVLGRNPADPDMQAMAHFLATPSGLGMAFILGMVVAVALAAAGGALASVVMRHPPRS